MATSWHSARQRFLERDRELDLLELLILLCPFDAFGAELAPRDGA
jgi:hypothetical protein